MSICIETYEVFKLRCYHLYTSLRMATSSMAQHGVAAVMGVLISGLSLLASVMPGVWLEARLRSLQVACMLHV